MGELYIGFICILMLFILLFIGIPVAFALALSGILGILSMTSFGQTLDLTALTYYRSIANWGFIIVPLFILMGELSASAGITQGAFEIAHKWVGKIKGSLAMATVIGCGAFAATTGSSAACAAAMGKIAIPEMENYGYSPKLAAGCVAAGGTVGVMIPPSGLLVLYGIATETSVGRLLIGGILPGILNVFFYLVTIYLITILLPKWVPDVRFNVSWKEKIKALYNGIGLIVLFIVVIGGIYAGIFTATEAGAFGAFAALLMVILRRKAEMMKYIISGLREAAKTTSMVFAIVAGAMLFSLMLTLSGIPESLTSFIVNLNVSKWILLVLFIIPFIPLGMFLDAVSIIFITIPIIWPILSSLGFNAIWFGIIVTKLLEISLITPPIGINVYVIKGVAPHIPLLDVFKGIIPFLIAEICLLSLLLIYPEIVLYLPGKMFK